jgi:uncharacterized protein (UPF0548 family)
MEPPLLPADQIERLHSLALSYPQVGATQGDLPPGYGHVSRSVPLGDRPGVFDGATEGLLGWQVQRRAGVRVEPATRRVVEGTDAVLLLGFGRLAIRAPVRVVYLIDEPDRQGFAYGTLPGHPETGEESFVLTRAADGKVTFTITAFSRPVSLLARLAGPAGVLTQRWVTGRYLRSLRP